MTIYLLISSQPFKVDQTSLPADNESEETEEKQDSKKFMSGLLIFYISKLKSIISRKYNAT